MARHRVLSPFKKFMLRSTGYSYTNMARLFVRLFVGIMLFQFGLKQLGGFNELKSIFPSVLGMSSEMGLILMIAIEMICSLCIMAGLFTRIMSVPPFLAMLVAQIYLLGDRSATVGLMPWQQQNYLPAMFMGFFFFLFLAGPGKISVDYLLSLRIIHSEDRNEEEELEIV